MTPARISGRKIRSAVGDTITQVVKQGEALDAVIADIGLIGEQLAGLPTPQATFLDRLRWLVRGNG